MNKKFIVVAMVSAVGISGPGYTQDRAKSPYLACAQDEAVRQFPSSASLSQIQTVASKNCERFFERNLNNSINSIISDARASGKPLPTSARSDLRPIMSPKLRHAFRRLVQLNVEGLRQRASSQATTK